MTRLVAMLSLAVLTALSATSSADRHNADVSGRVVDATTRQPIADAMVAAGQVEIRTDANGIFHVADAGVSTLGVRACGYLREQVPVRARRTTGGHRVDAVSPEGPVSLGLRDRQQHPA